MVRRFCREVFRFSFVKWKGGMRLGGGNKGSNGFRVDEVLFICRREFGIFINMVF